MVRNKEPPPKLFVLLIYLCKKFGRATRAAQPNLKLGEYVKNLAVGTVLGICSGTALFCFSIVSNTDNYLMFVSGSSMLMVVGGTLAVIFISFNELEVFRALKYAALILRPSSVNKKTVFRDVELIISWCNIIRSSGVVELEKDLTEATKGDSFLSHGAQLLLRNYSSEELRSLLERTLETTHQRNLRPVAILNRMAQVSPAFGMVGTLVGLVIMLDNLGGGMEAIGKGLAMALVTTLYGVLLAQLFYKPAASKILEKEQLLRFRNRMIIEALVMLDEEASPGRMEDHLNSYLEPQMYFTVARRGGESEVVPAAA